jgi:hypothetical protein
MHASGTNSSTTFDADQTFFDDAEQTASPVVGPDAFAAARTLYLSRRGFEVAQVEIDSVELRGAGGLTRPRAGDATGRRDDFVHAAEFCFAKAMLVVPRRYRFAAAVLAARAAVPLFRLTPAYREQELIGFDSPHEIALHFVLNALTRKGTRFDLSISVKGYEVFERARAKGRGVLVVGPHQALTLLLVRHFYERGLDPVVITPDPRMRAGGTCVTVRTLQPSPTFLVSTRSILRRGQLVCAMPDRAEHQGRRTVEFATARGRVIVAPALMQLAARCGAEVIFTEVHLEGRALVGTIAAPSAASADVIIKDFMEFVRARAEIRPSRQG